MKRWSVVLLLVIAVMAGYAVRTIAYQPTWPIDRTTDPAQRETAQAFYDALNDALGGASPDGLAALLSSAFVDHATDTGTTRTASAFLDEVRTVGSGASPLRLEALSIESSGTAVVVAVRQAPAEPIEAAGLTIEPGSPDEYTEVLRIERGMIVDRWAPAFSWLDLSTYDDKPLTISSSAGIATLLVRVALDGSAEQSWESLGIGLVLVETGAVSLTLTDRYGATTVSRWETGDFVSVPGGASARVRSADGEPASIELYLVTHVGAGSIPLPIKWNDDAAQTNARTVLWNGMLLWQSTEVTHRPARMVLPPNGTVRLTRPAGTALLVGAAGAVEVSIPGGGIAVIGPDRWPETMSGVYEIDAAHAASIEDDGPVTLRNPTDAPVAIVLISMERASASAPQGTPCPCPMVT